MADILSSDNVPLDSSCHSIARYVIVFNIFYTITNRFVIDVHLF